MKPLLGSLGALAAFSALLRLQSAYTSKHTLVTSAQPAISKSNRCHAIDADAIGGQSCTREHC